MFWKPRVEIDSLGLIDADVERAKQWWMAIFECKAGNPPEERDDPLPSDVALTLPGSEYPVISISNKAEVEKDHRLRQNEHSVLFTNNVKKAHEYLAGRGATPGPIQNSGGKEYFEIKDPEGNEIEICSA